jgi:hypothetical protein
MLMSFLISGMHLISQRNDASGIISAFWVGAVLEREKEWALGAHFLLVSQF